MQKSIYSKNGNVRTLLNVQEGYLVNQISLATGYIEDEDLVKSLNLSISDDISFHGYSRFMPDSKSLTFEFDLDNPIYFCLDRLLGEDMSLIIDDDDSRELMQKYMVIQRENTFIKIVFVNTNSNVENHHKFATFIRSVAPDNRSKINNITIKTRLLNFFKDCETTLLEEYHQITLREYLETKRINSLARTRTI